MHVKTVWRELLPGKHGRQGQALLQVWYLYKKILQVWDRYKRTLLLRLSSELKTKKNFLYVLKDTVKNLNRLKASASDLSWNKPSIKPPAAGTGFMLGLFRDKYLASAFNLLVKVSFLQALTIMGAGVVARKLTFSNNISKLLDGAPASASVAFALHHCHKPCRWLVAFSDVSRSHRWHSQTTRRPEPDMQQVSCLLTTRSNYKM